MDPIFDDLNNEQADGNACIVCNADYTTTGIYSVPVGISATTRSQVFACEAMCAPAVGYRPPVGEQLPLGDCGPACIAPEAHVHTSCPGPAVGAGMVSDEGERWRWDEREIDGSFTGSEFPRLWPPRRHPVAPGGES